MAEVKDLYILLNIIGSIGMAGIFVASFFRKGFAGSYFFMALFASCSIWAFFEACILLDLSFSVKVILTKLEYLGIVFLPPSFYMVSMIYTSGLRKWKIKQSIFFYTPSVFMLVAIWTNEYHNLVWTRFVYEDKPGFISIGVEHGIFFWLWIFICYTFLGIGLFYLVRFYKKASGLYKTHSLMLISAMSLPLILNIIYILGLSPFTNVDLTPFSFCIVAFIFALAFFRYNLLDVMPIAKEVVFENLIDPVIVVDFNNRVIDRNLSAKKLFSPNEEPVTGENIEKILRRTFINTDIFIKGCSMENELITHGRENPKTFMVNISDLRGKHGKYTGSIYVLRDISKRKLLEKELRRIADTDFLTGLLNRRSFMEGAKREYERVKRYGGKISVLSFDLDHFKGINDTYGHDAGDSVLREFAKMAKPLSRASDLFGRLGGEEFTFILPETSADSALYLAKRLISEFGKKIFSFNGIEKSFTVSCGCTEYRIGDQSIEEVLKRADIALYNAKEAGRNRIETEF